MFNPESESYDRTPEGAPEYTSILITLDPRLANLPDDLVAQKVVMGTDSPSQALCNLLSYYGQADLMARESFLDMMMAAGREEFPIFVYTNEANTELVMSMATYTTALLHPDFGNGSMLLTNEKLQEVAAKMQAGQFEKHGGFSPLGFIALEAGARPAQEPDQEPDRPSPRRTTRRAR